MKSVEFATRSRKELAAMARQLGVTGWHSMRKSELVLALVDSNNSGRRSTKRIDAAEVVRSESASRRRGRGRRATAENSRNQPNSPRLRQTPAAAARPSSTSRSPKPEPLKKMSLNGTPPVEVRKRAPKKPLDPIPGSPVRDDSLQIEFEGTHWIKVRWDISRQTHERAKAALGTQWHRAHSVIRLYDVTAEEISSHVKSRVFEEKLKAGIDVWYVPVLDLTRMYVLEIGYLAGDGAYFTLIKSGRIRAARTSGLLRVEHDEREKPAEATLAMARRMAGRAESRREKSRRASNLREACDHSQGHARSGEAGSRPLPFTLDAELHLYGQVPPGSQLTMFGELIETHVDGTFSLKLPLPNGRQVIPCVSVTHSIDEERTIIMAIERSTREMEPRQLEEDDL